jgi:hypothetical protein
MVDVVLPDHLLTVTNKNIAPVVVVCVQDSVVAGIAAFPFPLEFSEGVANTTRAGSKAASTSSIIDIRFNALYP